PKDEGLAGAGRGVEIRLVELAHGAIRALDGCESSGVDEQILDIIEELVSGGALHRPFSPQRFAFRENLLDDDRDLARSRSALLGARVGGRSEPAQIL